MVSRPPTSSTRASHVYMWEVDLPSPEDMDPDVSTDRAVCDPTVGPNTPEDPFG